MQRRKGFTLIELLVVIAIIGILATLVITQLAGARIKARNSSAKSDITEAGKAVEVFKGDDLSGEKAIAAQSAGTVAAGNPNNSATISCSVAGADAACRTDNLNNATASAGWLTGVGTGKAIWATSQASVGSTTAGGNSYGVQLTKTPGTGYVYFYTTTDVGAAPTNSGNLSIAGDYYFTADLSATGAATDATARFYYVHNGNSGNNGSTSATAYKPIL